MGGRSSLSGGRWWNGSRSDERLTRENHVETKTGVHSAGRANRADKEPDCVEVRASIVAEKRGNARGVKGRRKIEQIRPAGRNRPPLVIGLSEDRSVQGGELCPVKGVQRNTLRPNLIRCWQAAIKDSQTPVASSHCVAEPRTSLIELPGPIRHASLTVDPIRLESRMRENRLSGSEGGATSIPSSLPLSIIQSLRDKGFITRDVVKLMLMRGRGTMSLTSLLYPAFLRKGTIPRNFFGEKVQMAEVVILAAKITAGMFSPGLIASSSSSFARVVSGNRNGTSKALRFLTANSYPPRLLLPEARGFLF